MVQERRRDLDIYLAAVEDDQELVIRYYHQVPYTVRRGLFGTHRQAQFQGSDLQLHGSGISRHLGRFYLYAALGEVPAEGQPRTDSPQCGICRGRFGVEPLRRQGGQDVEVRGRFLCAARLRPYMGQERLAPLPLYGILVLRLDNRHIEQPELRPHAREG